MDARSSEGRGHAGSPGSPFLREVFSSKTQMGAVAVSPDARVFFNYSRWFGPVPVAVAELRDGKAVPYPDEGWSRDDPSLPPGRRFVSAQSVYVDPTGRSLWVVDPANPEMGGLVEEGTKLVEVDLRTDEIVRALPLGTDLAPKGSYLNDVRIDAERGVAYLSDLGLGALVLVDLEGAGGRRLLEGHPSTRAQDVTLTVGGRPWLMPDGSARRVHASGVALDPENDFLYYKPLSGRALHRVPTAALREEEALTEGEIGAAAEFVAEVGGTDSIDFGPDGRLYLTAIEEDAITSYEPRTQRLETVIRDQRLSWPRSVAFGTEGSLFVTTYRLHEGAEPTDEYKIYELAPGEREPASAVGGG